MVTILLEQIIEILKGWLSSFTSWAEDVAEKLGLIEEATEYIDDIYDETTQIQTNTSSIVTSNNMIQGYSFNISNKTNNIDNNVTAIKNNVGSIATSSGAAAAFAEDIATNTLNTDNRLVTIGSDTTQLRSNSNTITADVSDIKAMLNYFSYGLIVTEDVEGAICSFDTDLIDYIQNLKVAIEPDNDGFSSVNITRTGGKNLIGGSKLLANAQAYLPSGTTDLVNKTFEFQANATTTEGLSFTTGLKFKENTQYTIIFVISKNSGSGTNLRIYYTDGTWTNIGTATEYNTKFTILYKTNASKTVASIRKTNSSNKTTLYYDECGVFEGDISETDFEPYKGNTFNISLGTTVTDGGELDALTGLLKINTTPVTYSYVDPIAIRTFSGLNNVYADTGDSTVTYKETLKHKIDKEA